MVDETVALVTLDLGRAPSARLLDRVRARVARSGVRHAIFNASHTHGGPVIEDETAPHMVALEGQLGDCIEAAAKAGRSIIVVPLSFVSEHSETLYELDQVYRDLALEKGAADYIRVRTVETHPAFIAGLASLVRERMDAVGMGAEGGKILCGPQESCACRMALRSS